MEKTYLFYDIETTGLNKCFDQVIQFAAIRTNLDLEELQRHEFYFKLNNDVVPSPHAFVTHRIRLSTLQQGLNEIEGMQKIHALLNTPGTISIGYNSLGFDDEFLRFSFYRNLLPPYSHQYANQCSRMDLYPMTIMYYLFKKEILAWPENNLKLENLNKLNHFATGQAHNAMVDVIASINLARCFKNSDIATWNYLSGFFNKDTDLTRCQQASNHNDISIMIDGKFGHQQDYQAPVMSLGNHLHYKNKLIWLRLDTDALVQIDATSFEQYTWAINKKLGEPAWILPLKDRFMKTYLREKDPQIREVYHSISNNQNLLNELKNHYRNYTYPKIANLDHNAALYDNGFLTAQEEEICQKIHRVKPQDKATFLSALLKPHLRELLLRLLGRHYPDVLSAHEQEQYQQYCANAFEQKENCPCDYKGQTRLTPREALTNIEQLRHESLDVEQQTILAELEAYIKQKFQ